MTLNELREKVREWDSKISSVQIAPAYYQTVLNELDYHSSREWKVYLPAEHNPDHNASYMERLASWIGNVSDEDDQKLLLDYALQISFFSHEDFIALYRTAFNREVTRWIMGLVDASLQSGLDDFREVIGLAAHQHTWYCPVTDSMDINEFYKVNNLQGVGQRPSFSSLHSLAEHPTDPNGQIADDLIRYMGNPHPKPNQGRYPPLDYIVLLEDIVGSASQCIEAVRWATQRLGKPVLFIPLIICPSGVENLRNLEGELHGSLKVSPVVELSPGDLLGPKRGAESVWSRAQEMEALVSRCATESPFWYEPFGFRNTGSSIVTFTNTPDNTIPLVHDKGQSGNWKPLFPRVYRDT